MTTPIERKDFTKDRLGRAFKMESGERFQPIRTRYRLTDRDAFEAVARSVIPCPRACREAVSCFMETRPNEEGCYEILGAAVAMVRPDMRREMITVYLRDRVPALLRPGSTAPLTIDGKTARDISRAARRKTVQGLKAHRRQPKGESR